MALTAAALGETQLAFDAVAATYDGANRANPLIEAMRERTMDALLCRVTSGSRLLDLGCGPGQDAVALAERGFSVTAIDWSNAMVQQTEARAARHCVSTTVETRHLGIHDLAALRGCEFDAAYSNLGPLNCVPDLTRTARDLAAVLRKARRTAGRVGNRPLLPVGTRSIRPRRTMAARHNSLQAELRACAARRSPGLDALLRAR